jgi:hypothetical protein
MYGFVLVKAVSQNGLGCPFLRGWRLSELPSLGQEPLRVSFRAFGAAP